MVWGEGPGRILSHDVFTHHIPTSMIMPEMLKAICLAGITQKAFRLHSLERTLR